MGYYPNNSNRYGGNGGGIETQNFASLQNMIYTNKGFTLIEVLAAITLIALALIPIMVIVPQIIENSLNAEQLTTAVFLAESKMEEVKCGALNNFTPSRDESATPFASPYAGYKYTVTDNEDAQIKVIQVRAWHDKDLDNALDADEQSLTIDTKVAKRE